MTEQDTTTTVGPLPNTATDASPPLPAALTRLVWLLWAASVGALAARVLGGWSPSVAGVVAVDGLTVLMWTVVTFFSGVVHSYSRRYMAGDERESAFFARVFGFTLTVMVLVAADHLALFVAAWLAMGLLMADLVGHVKGWPQARAAAALARRSFVASTALVAVALGALWWATGATTVSGAVAAADAVSGTPWLVAAGALLLAAMVQSALVPFHTWLLASMTAPTPASALMHAGFVNAGGVLLVRFAPVVSAEPGFMLLVLAVGAASALLGKLLKAVRTDVKGQLGCSTVGQMGFMIMQAGLGFFGAALTHLVLHGFYKAYQFLSAGEAVEHTSPAARTTTGSAGPVGWAVTLLTGLAGAGVFVLLTGKGTALDGGLLLAGLVALTTLHATHTTVARTDAPAAVRYGAAALVFLPAIAGYALVYRAVGGLLSGVPTGAGPVELTAVHGVVAAAFLAAYEAIETGAYRENERLYAALVNATQAPGDALLTATEEYNDY